MENNFIIHQQAQKYQWSGECFLSIKSFYHGAAEYQIKQREYRVDQKSFLVLNECTKYRLTIDNTHETESFCIFFSPKFVSCVLSELQASDKEILDFNLNERGGIRLFEKKYSQKGALSKLLKIGKAKSRIGMSDIEKDEYYHQVLYELIRQNGSLLQDIDRLSSKKKSTRKEIYQRILFVKDYIDKNYTENVRLSDLAQVGMLSENHLLRNFKQILGMTPFQYISQKRIWEAKRQIQESNKPIKDIATDLGYSSFGNFSTYFKTIVGLSPSEIRKK